MAMTAKQFKKVMGVSWTAYMHPDPKVRRRAMRELNVLQPLPKVDVRVFENGAFTNYAIGPELQSESVSQS